MSKQDISQPSWKFRRRAIFGSLIFSALIILYVAARWDDTQIGDTLALGAFGLMGAIVASYIGGATYQDVKLYRQSSLNDKKEPEPTDPFAENGIVEDMPEDMPAERQ